MLTELVISGKRDYNRAQSRGWTYHSSKPVRLINCEHPGRERVLKPRIHFGTGKLAFLPKILAAHDVRTVLLISGNSAYSGSGAERSLSSLASRFQVVRFSDFTANPTIKEVEEAIGLVRDTNCDAVVAIGGGTALDIGKSAAIFATQDQGSVSYLRTNLPLRPRNCLLVLVPTTAGSGSEVTSFCTIYVDGIKKSLDDPLVLADYVIADPNLLTHLPPRIAASAALDALCQAIESFWSVRSTWRSRQLAAQALRLTLAHLKTFCSKPTSNDRTAMARAAILAGKAINITRTTAPHAVSYALTSVFGVPHGHACALTLPGFLRYNAMVTDLDVADSRGVRWVRRRIAEIIHMLGATDYEEACLRLHELIRSSGLEPRLSLLGLGSAEIERLLICGFDLQRAGNNPRRLTTDGVREVLTLSL